MLSALIRRNTKLFFKDKGMFFTSLITPLILILLFVTFLGNVYRDSFRSCIPAGIEVPDTLVEGFVGGWLFSSLLAVCCVTVAFCSNMLMVQDKVTGARRDITIAPVKRSALALGYYISTALATLIICGIALAACFVYLSSAGWYLSTADILFTILDVFLLVMFGTALSSVINFFLSSQGQMSGHRDACQFLLWFCLRCIYAHFAVFERDTEVYFIFARNIRYSSSASSSYAEGFWRNWKMDTCLQKRWILFAPRLTAIFISLNARLKQGQCILF